MNYKVPEGTVAAAQALLAAGTGLNVRQVDGVDLRDIDANAEDPVRVVHLIPLGGTLGVVIGRQGQGYKDEDIVFVSMSALGSAMDALGFSAVAPAAYLVAPENSRPSDPKKEAE